MKRVHITLLIVIIVCLSIASSNAQSGSSIGIRLTTSGQTLDPRISQGAVAGDFNNDGHLDVFLVSQDMWQGRGCGLYFGDGNGFFTDSAQTAINSFTYGAGVERCDLNDDGRLDIITGNTVWLNQGQGQLSRTSLSLSVSGSVYVTRFDDLNGDGHLDLAAQMSGGFRVFLNDGEGHFNALGQPFASDATNIILGDLNGDGFADAITSGWRDSASQAICNRVWFNDGRGNLIDSGQRLNEGVAHVHGLALGDLNGDGSLDLAMGLCNNASLAARVFFNDGRGHFNLAQSIPGSQGHGVPLGDFDGDGSLDLFVIIGIVGATSSNRIWLNNGQGQFHDSSVRLGTVYTTGVALGDFNEDGKLDVFISHIDYPNAFTARGVPPEVWLNITPTADPNGPIENQTTGERFSVIQYAIDLAGEGDDITMEPGIYEESIRFDKNITLQSLDPNNPYYIGGTIIQGDPNSAVLTIDNRSESCEIAGLTLRAGSIGIMGTNTDATISNCRIMDNRTHGVELTTGSDPVFLHCLITANGMTGMTLHKGDVRFECRPIIEDCVIVHNGEESLVGGQPVVTNSIVQE